MKVIRPAIAKGGTPMNSVADPGQAFGGAVKLGGAKNVFTCLNTKGCLRQKRLSFVGHKVAILLVELCYFSGNNHSLKALYIINSENV